MFGLKKDEVDTINAAAHTVAVIERPAAKVPSYVEAKRTTDADLGEYSAVARELGVECPHLVVEEFMAVMERLNLPIYNRAEVVKYMNWIAKRDGTGFGWEWRPVRAKDHIPGAHFGQAAADPRDDILRRGMMFGMENANAAPTIEPASDYYHGPESDVRMVSIFQSRFATPKRYDKVVPLRALKRMAAIEKGYEKPVHFLVSDYATQPHIKPDPFLLAVIPGIPSDMGRFVIDFWDEPGFGIDKMLA